MARCELCDKSMITGHQISITRSHVSRRANRKWKPNLRRIRIVRNGTPMTIYACTRCIRSGKVERAV